MISAYEPVTPLLSNARERVAKLPRGHFVDGEFVAGGNDLFPIVNPASGELLCEVQLGSASTVDLAVSAARAALAAWKRTPPAVRADALFRLAGVIEANADLFAELESLNVGKPLSVSREEIPLAADALRFMAGAARTAQAPAAGEYVAGQLSVVRREAVGVVGAMAPWNYPLMMMTWKIAPALAAGNTVVLKPSELTPLTTLLFCELTAGILPPGVLNVVVGTGAEVGVALTQHPDIAMVSLTGGVETGKAVAASASGTLKRVHLELGGKAPVVVFDDADVDAVVSAIKVMGFWNTGQECGAATRVLVDAAIHDKLVAKLAGAIAAITVGDPAESEDIEVGPLVSAAQRDRVVAALASAESDGATIRVGGAALDRPGFYFQPTLITGVMSGTRLAREEIFGPVVTVETFADEQEAVAKANAVAYGLAASVWTGNGARALRMTDALDFGTVWVNSHLTLSSEMPWGGFGASGYGRDMSTLGLDDYTRTKHIMFSTEG